ncbi:MAG: ankyrin repeat domain-containing protein [Chlorobiota bacterium]
MNYYHVIDEFINAGVDINSKSNNFHHNYNALFLAIETAKNYELVKALIDLGADVHDKDLTGNNALFIACRNFKENSDSIKIVELLLSKKVSIESKNTSGVSVKSYVNMIGEAIDHGHNPNSFDLRPLISEDFRN